MRFHFELTSARRTPPKKVPAEPTIRIASLADLPYVVSLQKRFTNELGFLPTAALSAWIERSCVLLVEENGDPAGYVVQRPRLNTARWCRPLTQVAVAMDAQRRHLGLALLRRVATDAHRELLEGLQCWVAADIEAVDFFTSANFEVIARRRPRNVRGRELLLMRASLQPFKPANFSTIPPIAGCRPSRILVNANEPIFVGRNAHNGD